MFSKEAIKLAKPVVEAIKKIAEKVPKECPECDGTGYPAYNPSSKDKELLTNDRGECFNCNGTGRVKGK